MIQKLSNFFSVLRVGAIPPSFVYPFPIASFVAVAISGASIEEFVLSYIFCFLSFTASNLWNHVNDLEDDLRAGRSEAKILAENFHTALTVSVSFYMFSAVVFVLFSKVLSLFPLLVLCIILNWMYSDKMLLGRIIRRLKEHYVTELLTYVLLIPSFFLVFWTFFNELSKSGLAFSFVMSVYYISAIFLKDLKDISSDEKAGYRTLAVVFDPRTLLKTSIVINILGSILILIFSVVGIFPELCALSSAPILLVLYITLGLWKKGWRLSKDLIPLLKLYPYTYLASILLLGFTAFISNL